MLTNSTKHEMGFYPCYLLLSQPKKKYLNLKPRNLLQWAMGGALPASFPFIVITQTRR